MKLQPLTPEDAEKTKWHLEAYGWCWECMPVWRLPSRSGMRWINALKSTERISGTG